MWRGVRPVDPLSPVPATSSPRSKPLEGFARVNIGNAFHVEIKESPQFSVSISADDNVIDLVEAEKEGDTLRIGLEAGDYSEVTLRARITMPELLGVMLTGASRATLEGFSSANDLSISLSGSSVLEGYVEAREADLRINGASKLTLAGSADNLSVRASGASILSLQHFSVDRSSIVLDGASQATVNVRRDIEYAPPHRRFHSPLRWRTGFGGYPDFRRIQDRVPAQRGDSPLLAPTPQPCSTEAEQTARYGASPGVSVSTSARTPR